MRVILCGGGSAEKTILINRQFSKIIDHSKELLYIPLARDYATYEDCLKWVYEEFKTLDIPGIKMITNANELVDLNLDAYCAIFIGGGKIYKLLSELKNTKAYELIKAYILNNGIVYGCSAGAVILGKNIDAAQYLDPNTIGLEDTEGFDCINGYSFCPHYTNKDAGTTAQITNYLSEYSKINEPVYALPEDMSIFINGDEMSFIGNSDYYIFKNGELFKINKK